MSSTSQAPTVSASDERVTVTPEYIIGPGQTPFYTCRWAPATGQPRAYLLFVHGFCEHIARYDHLFRKLAAPANGPGLHITAFDQRGHGRTSHDPLTADSPEAKRWKAEGKAFKLEKGAKRRTGGWAKVLPDIEWFVRRESELAKSNGRPLFLWGFSMGGGEVLTFATKARPDVIALLSGVIAGGSLIRLAKRAPWIQLKAGTLAASVGLGNMLIPAPMVHSDLSHNDESNERAKADPFCEQVGTTRGMADMINGGMALDAPQAWDRWPAGLPLMLYHGSDDNICHVDGSRNFAQGVKGKGHDVHLHVLDGMYHEVHNELEPTPTDIAVEIARWVGEHSPPETTATATATTTAAPAEPAEGGVAKL